MDENYEEIEEILSKLVNNVGAYSCAREASPEKNNSRWLSDMVRGTEIEQDSAVYSLMQRISLYVRNGQIDRLAATIRDVASEYEKDPEKVKESIEAITEKIREAGRNLKVDREKLNKNAHTRFRALDGFNNIDMGDSSEIDQYVKKLGEEAKKVEGLGEQENNKGNTEQEEKKEEKEEKPDNRVNPNISKDVMQQFGKYYCDLILGMLNYAKEYYNKVDYLDHRDDYDYMEALLKKLNAEKYLGLSEAVRGILEGGRNTDIGFEINSLIQGIKGLDSDKLTEVRNGLRKLTEDIGKESEKLRQNPTPLRQQNGIEINNKANVIADTLKSNMTRTDFSNKKGIDKLQKKLEKRIERSEKRIALSERVKNIWKNNKNKRMLPRILATAVGAISLITAGATALANTTKQIDNGNNNYEIADNMKDENDTNQINIDDLDMENGAFNISDAQDLGEIGTEAVNAEMTEPTEFVPTGTQKETTAETLGEISASEGEEINQPTEIGETNEEKKNDDKTLTGKEETPKEEKLGEKESQDTQNGKTENKTNIQFTREDLKHIHENAKGTELRLGTIISGRYLEGIQFSETAFSGGRTGSIKKESDVSPVDGFYVIDYYARETKDGVDIESGSDYSNSAKLDASSNLKVHIRFIKGAKTQQDAARILLEEQKSGKTLTEAEKHERGWMDSTEVQDRLKRRENVVNYKVQNGMQKDGGDITDLYK